MKKYICLLLVIALVLSLGTTAFAEQEIENSGQETVTEIEEATAIEENEPPPGNIDNPEAIKNNEENVATSTDIETNPEQPEKLGTTEEKPPLFAAPPENGADDGTGETHVVTVSWEIEDAAINISSSSSYVWNTETLQYEKQSSEGVALGNRRTIEVSITITNQYGYAIDYSVVYSPNNSVLQNSEAPSGEGGSSGQIANGASLTYTGTVTITDITNSEHLADGAVIMLGTYSVTISSAERT